MKTSAVLSLRYLTSKIHPPLPLNPRDSQKLLALLTTSFQAHLDQEHGKIESSKTSATDVHLQSVLDNPLFSIPTHLRSNIKHGGMQKSGRNSASTLIDIEDSNRNTIENFEEHISSGTASIDLAKLCLETYVKSFRVVSAGGIDSKLSSKVSATMLQWLWSSGLDWNLKFLMDSKLVALIMPFLLVDGRDRHAYIWLSRLRSKLTGPPNTSGENYIRDNFRMQSNLVFSLIASEARYGSGLNGAMRAFLRNVDSANEWIGTLQDHRMARPSTIDARWALHRAGNYIVHRLALLKTTSGIDIVDFEKLVQSTDSWSSNISLDRAQLALLHPVAPDPLTSLQYIRKEMRDAKQSYTSSQKTRAINLCLDTSKVLLSQGRHVDAQWVLSFVRNTFPQEIGNLEQNPETAANRLQHESTTAKTESGLRELEALAFG
ncbi:hypothetical protein MMC11_006335 [Xylographa trunciseda]|nr:hypothetical protein [Xylographa trunciseda]